MSETGQSRGRRSNGVRWIGIGAAVVLVVAFGIWAFLGFRPASEAGAASPSGTSASFDPEVASPTPQPTEFSTPAPGATDPVPKPEESVEVPLDEPATAAGGVVVEVTSIEQRTVDRQAPGEPSGPALAVTVRVSNNGSEAVDTSGSSVNLTYGGDERIPAVALSSQDTSVLPASVAPGASASAVYLFSRPEVPSGDIRVIFDLLATEPDVVFVGPEP